MTPAIWVLGMWAGASVVFLLGYCCRHLLIEPCTKCRQWQALVDELEGEQDTTRAELDKALQTVQDLNHNIGVAFDAGIVQGQLLQAERQAEGL